MNLLEIFINEFRKYCISIGEYDIFEDKNQAVKCLYGFIFLIILIKDP